MAAGMKSWKNPLICLLMKRDLVGGRMLYRSFPIQILGGFLGGENIRLIFFPRSQSMLHLKSISSCTDW